MDMQLGPVPGLETMHGLKPGEVATGVCQCDHICTSGVDSYAKILPLLLSQTTIMAVEFDGGVVMGADSRTSTGKAPCYRRTCD